MEYMCYFYSALSNKMCRFYSIVPNKIYIFVSKLLVWIKNCLGRLFLKVRNI